jgi:integrase
MPTRSAVITERLAASLVHGDPNAEANTFIRDPSLIGFAIRVGARKSSYVVEGRAGRGGRFQRFTLGTVGKLELDEARTQAKERIGELARGADLAQELREKIAERLRENVTIGDGLARALGQPLSKATIYDYERDSAAIGWNEKKVSSITAAMIAEKFRDLGAGTSASRAMRSLRRFWNCARELDPTLPAFPTTELKKQRKSWATPPRKQRTIPDALMPAWRSAIAAIPREDARDLTMFVTYTGCRIGEALKLDAADVNLRADVFTLRGTKNGKDCTLPMTRQTRAILARRVTAAGTGRVFPQDVIRRQLAPSVAVTPWSWHDLRRCFIGAAHRAGVPDLLARSLTNHATPAADAHAGYIVATPDVLRPMAQKTCDYLDALGKANVRKLRRVA